MPYSKQLARLAEKDDRIAEYEFDSGNDCGEHWLHLAWPYFINDGASIHELTVADCLGKMSEIHKRPIAHRR